LWLLAGRVRKHGGAGAFDRQMRHRLIIASPLVLVAVASAAHAIPAIARGAKAEEPADRSTEIAVGMLIGGADVGPVTGTGFGVQLMLGRRFGDWTLFGELDYLGISHKNDAEPKGSQTRGALIGRYNLMSFGGDKVPIMGTFWLEGGLGVQRFAWDAGGVLTRPDAALGFGFSWSGVIDRHKPEKRKTIGWFIGVRLHYSQAPSTGEPQTPMCAGPCDHATGPSRNDVAVMADFGLHWGH